MAQNRQDTAGSLDHLLLANVLRILAHQIGNGVLSFSVAYDIYLAIAKDLHIVLSTAELDDVRSQFEKAGQLLTTSSRHARQPPESQ
jgi:hypothetical protein